MACEPVPDCVSTDQFINGPGGRVCCSIEPMSGIESIAVWFELCAPGGTNCPIVITMNRDVVGECCDGLTDGELDEAGNVKNAASGTELARLVIANMPVGGCFRLDSGKRERTMTVGNLESPGLPYIDLTEGQATTPWLIYDGCFPVCVCAQTQNYSAACSPDNMTFTAGWVPLQV